ncbi:hypothetical protein AXG93_1660s1000 [Marchantia polymorpha subsp. ruderalis]|uniref:Uncharacterized protein n=1 Tax=Marchantia polymorpha subsp. ruderalis TaxID=1480154 RepID=A0A176VSN2_MARPO|nr:hypothetical protein AXG93_1660s1000 [Marchantia polymorpha subsp. ruderalis]
MRVLDRQKKKPIHTFPILHSLQACDAQQPSLQRVCRESREVAEIFEHSMAKSIPLRIVPLRVPQVGLRVFQDELMVVKLDFLLWGWNWVCSAMVREWLREKDQPPRGYRAHPERWRVSDWEQVLEQCAGEEGDLMFKCESVHLSKEEEIFFGTLFKNCKSSKNGYRTRDYIDRKRRNVAVALLQILQPHRTTYMTSWQVGLLSRANPGRYVRDVEVDTDPDKKARKLILPADSSTDTGRATVARDSPSSEEDVSAEVLERLTDLPAPKSRVPSEEMRKPSGHRGRHAATARMPAMERCLPFEQVPFNDSPSSQGSTAQASSVQEQFREEPSGQTPSVQKPLEQVAAGEGRDGETRVPLAQAPLAVAVRAGVAGPSGADSPTPLEVLAGHGEEVAAEEAARPSARESPRISAATELLETEDDKPSEEEEVKSVRGTPTGVLCKQVVPLLWYLDRKATKYGDPRQRGIYVELVRNRTQMKVATNPELMALDQKYRQLEERYNFLEDQCTLSRKLQKTAIQLRDELVSKARKIEELRASVETEFSSEQAQNRILAGELVR